MNKNTLCRALTLALTLAATTSTWACSLRDTRQQVAVLAAFSAQPLLPQEVSLRAGDLVSVLVPRSASLRVVDVEGNASDTVTALEAERYQRLSRYNRGRAPAEIRAGVYPAHLEWRHFGTGLPGVAYLMLTVDREQALLRVQVAESPIVSRGQELVWSDARQGDAIHLTPFDTLAFNLPGRPGDGWQVEMAGRLVAVTTIATLEPVADASAARVLLRLKAADVLAGVRADTLTVRHADRAVYRFTVRPLAMAAC